ncbi:hypothetical protein OS493_026755 [Desmophyllum pertusum]|uniref:Nuclease HARBI1 n=1 Tax=Desmophyllum pertusum TaxID=174260 RepID=A0A9W9ZYK6_9CNID|nr:hypothetical protein OS493_026755 [Desmophyllum pertusum]
MIFVNPIFVALCCSLLFDPFQAASSVSNASNQITAASSNYKCHNVHFNNYYSGPANNDIKAHLLKIENQLADVQKKIDAMTGNKTASLELANIGNLQQYAISASRAKCVAQEISLWTQGATWPSFNSTSLRVPTTVIACCVLHNLCIDVGDESPIEPVLIQDDVDFDDEDCIDWPAMDENGKQLRETIRNYLDTYGY